MVHMIMTMMALLAKTVPPFTHSHCSPHAPQKMPLGVTTVREGRAVAGWAEKSCVMTVNGNRQTEQTGQTQAKEHLKPGKRDREFTFYCQSQSQPSSGFGSGPIPTRVPATVVQEIQICKISRGPGPNRPL